MDSKKGLSDENAKVKALKKKEEAMPATPIERPLFQTDNKIKFDMFKA